MRIGDIVLHKPSGEHWVVAKVCEDVGVIAQWNQRHFDEVPATFVRHDEKKP